MSKIIAKREPLTDGQKEREVKTLRRWPTQKLNTVVIAKPGPLAASVSAALGGTLSPIVVTRRYKEKQIGSEIEYFRWMKPGPDGTLVPREQP